LEIKYGNKESTRTLLERCLTLKLNHKKMKFFFLRYLQYEISLGDENRIEYVKKKALEHVESVKNNQEGESMDLE
jgi:rRNA biogenesis protein RRP5